MSEQKRISPLLDGFSLGTPMSEHDGVRCCPAIKENTDKKYIVKIITIPASQVQLDALLIAGAYKDPADAMEYYKGVGEDVMKEAELLQKLSKLDGFLSYEGWQMEPITRKRLGYEVYLVSSYKRSLDKYVRHNPVTHLEAVNLGLDLCAALTVCRQAGAIYVDLKPTNIYVSEKKEYRIGDLGFVNLDALRYTALPEKYRSVYTPPEAFDPMAPLNLTLDTYAVGMILYQIYNEGRLPFKEKAPEEALPSPINADYELAEIIMKAIDPDPANRWQDPADMGKALASYMQRNSINDVPITPHTPLNARKKKKKADKKKPVQEIPAVPAEVQSETTSEAIPVEEAAAESASAAEVVPEPVSSALEIQADETTESIVSEDNADVQNISSEQTESGVTSNSEENEAAVPEPEEEAAVLSEEAPDETYDEDEDDQDETAPDDEDADSLLPHEMSEELTRMMAKADDLIAHETPEGVVVPEAPELPDPFAFVLDDLDNLDSVDIPLDPVMEDPADEKPRKARKKSFASQKGKRILKKILSTLLSILILAGIAAAAFGFYKFFYLQTIDDIRITGEQDTLTVTVDTDTDPSLLTVTCSDHYGNVITKTLTGGKATFKNLLPDTMYTIELDIEGFHKLVGQTSDIFTTEATTSIVSFSAVAGSDDGSAILSFTVDGEEPVQWSVIYEAEGEEPKKESFNGHTVTIDGLSIGKVYTFTLDAGKDLSLDGSCSLDFLASRLILAQELSVTSSGNSDMTVHWKAPGDIVVDSWDVRCYNDAGYEEKLSVTDTSVYLTGIDPNYSYTVEVTASGMTQPARASITANPINITAFHVDDSASEKLSLSWEFDGAAPEGGWLLLYSIDGGKTNSVLKPSTPFAEILPRIPGAKYQFTLQAADSTSIFSNTHSYTCPAAESYNANNISAGKIEGMLVKTPEADYWHYGKLESDAVTDTFAVGDPISVILHATTDFYLPGAQKIDILYVMRDAYGNVIPDLISEKVGYWKEIWSNGDVHYAELDLPVVPEAAGEYTLDVYFNGYAITEVTFTVTE